MAQGSETRRYRNSTNNIAGRIFAARKRGYRRYAVLIGLADITAGRFMSLMRRRYRTSTNIIAGRFIALKRRMYHKHRGIVAQKASERAGLLPRARHVDTGPREESELAGLLPQEAQVL